MYLQDIVISPDILKKIRDSFQNDEFLDLRSYIQNLKLKKLVLDKGSDNSSKILEVIRKIVEESDQEAKRKLRIILELFLQESGRIKYIQDNCFKQYLKGKDNIDNNCLINLAALTESKILNTEDNALKLLSLNEKELGEVEFVSFNEFAKPPKTSRLYSIEKTIEIRKGEKFVFEPYFAPYFYDAVEVTVADRYIRKEDGGFLNLLRILGICPNIRKLNIGTITSNNLEKFKFDLSIEELKTKIRSDYSSLEVEIRNSDSHQRIIATERFRFVLDPGMDFVNRNYIAERHDLRISIEPIQSF